MTKHEANNLQAGQKVAFRNDHFPSAEWDKGVVLSVTPDRVTIKWDDGDESWFVPECMDLVEVGS